MAVLPALSWCFTSQTSVDSVISTSDQPSYFIKLILHILAHVHVHLFTPQACVNV